MPDDLISETAAAAILGVSQQRVNQIPAGGSSRLSRRAALGARASSIGGLMSSVSGSSVCRSEAVNEILLVRVDNHVPDRSPSVIRDRRRA